MSHICYNVNMINEVYELVIYSDETGREPFIEWLESLQKLTNPELMQGLPE